MKDICIHYFVEGDDEKKLLNVLKTQLKVIKPGKVQKLNVVEKTIPTAMLRTFKNPTVVVLVFDTDTNTTDILRKNIDKLNCCGAISEVITIPQVPNLESELVCSCNIKKITELLGSKSKSEFKSDLLHITNLDNKLLQHEFNINAFWNKNPKPPFNDIKNGAKKIKL